MKMKYYLLPLVLTLSIISTVKAQEQPENLDAINDYKYIVVPVKFDFLNDADKHQLNSLTKFLFNKYGYKAYLESDPYPEDLKENKCLGLTSEVVKVKGGFLVTKIQINLLDCHGNLVTSSQVGKSREKEFRVAYNLALRAAFQTFQTFNYTYKPDPNASLKLSKTPKPASKHFIEEQKNAKAEIEQLKQELAKLEKEKKQKEIQATQAISNVNKVDVQKPIKKDISVLYAQVIENGFQVVNSKPEVVMILLETPKENTFIVKDQNAMVYKEDGFWYLTKNDGKSISIETLNIKF